MYKYTIQAFDDTDMGKLNLINIVVQADDDDSAIAKAKAIKARGSYSILSIEELTSREFKKG